MRAFVQMMGLGVLVYACSLSERVAAESSAQVQPEVSALQAACDQAATSVQARVGIAVYVNGAEEPTACVAGEAMYPMMSVVKFPLAIAVLQGVAAGKWGLDQTFELSENDLAPDTWSPLRDHFPRGGRFSLRELLCYMLAQSDNNVCDFCFKLVGGPHAVQLAVAPYLLPYTAPASLRIRTDERGLRNPALIAENSATPAALCRLLQSVQQAAAGRDPRAPSGQRFVLPKAEAELLLQMMALPSACMTRLNAGVPEGCILSHKTGSSGTLPSGLIGAQNDVGIIRLRNGLYACVAVMVADSRSTSAENDRVMGRVAAAVVHHMQGLSISPSH